jgi:Reverse transcriptase (RNA-dependent DNA polymerase)
VVKGYTQTYGVDYQETFSPIAKMNTIRILLSIATNKKWTLYQMDVKNIFLQGILDEEVYMACPLGYKKVEDSNIMCKLNKSIYGLKQSSRAWYGKLSSYLISCNFKVSNVDHSLFSKRTCNFTIIVLVYVDDIIITGNSMVEIKRVKSQLIFFLILRIWVF